jgi:phosphoribosylglycinamide formyltransferase-1
LSDRDDAKCIDFAKKMNIKSSIVNYKEFKDKVTFEQRLIELILDSKTDLICLAGFMRILSPLFVARFKNSIINIHPSLLPLFPGLDTHKKVLTSGMAVHGATVHLVTSKLDGGKILGQCIVPVLKNDSEESLSARLLKQEHKLYPQVVRKFINGEEELLLLL